jgi:hypothetical protein
MLFFFTLILKMGMILLEKGANNRGNTVNQIGMLGKKLSTFFLRGIIAAEDVVLIAKSALARGSVLK